ncbi:hypothetical protein Aduo_011513 [Ancylostoma duodenale]
MMGEIKMGEKMRKIEQNVVIVMEKQQEIDYKLYMITQTQFQTMRKIDELKEERPLRDEDAFEIPNDLVQIDNEDNVQEGPAAPVQADP